MKRIVVIAIAAMMACVSAQTVSAATQVEKKNQPEDQSVTFHKKVQEVQTVVLRSEGVHCSNCAKKISENIAFEKGVKGLEITLNNKCIKITYDAKKTTVEKLQAALRKLGYESEVVE